MKKRYVFFIFIFAATMMNCQKYKPSDVDIEKQAVKTVIDNYVKSIVAEDIDLYGRAVSNDSAMINIGGSEGLSWIEGWESLRDVIIGQNDSFSETAIEVPEEKIFMAPSAEFAWAVNRWNLKTTLKDGHAYLLPLRCSWILEKKDNQWIIVHFHKSFGVKSLADYQITEAGKEKER